MLVKGLSGSKVDLWSPRYPCPIIVFENSVDDRSNIHNSMVEKTPGYGTCNCFYNYSLAPLDDSINIFSPTSETTHIGPILFTWVNINPNMYK